MGHAPDFTRIRRGHVAERLASHRNFDLHGEVNIGRVLVTTLDRSLGCLDCRHTRPQSLSPGSFRITERKQEVR